LTDGRQNNKIEFVHVISCQNLINDPLDPFMIGLTAQSKKDIVVKTYDSNQLEQIPSTAQFLAENSKGKLELVHVNSINDQNLSRSKSTATYNPRFIYLVDFVARFEFLSNPEFTKSFNFMEKYKFKKLKLRVYNTKINMHEDMEVFVADLQAEEVFRYANSHLVLVEKEDKYLPITDKDTFHIAYSYLLEHYRFAAESLGLSVAGSFCSPQMA